MALILCPDPSPAHWLVDESLPWDRLVMFGPSRFKAYARLRFLPDPAYEGQSENDVEFDDDDDVDPFPILFDVLGRHTATPDDCYFCLWDGYGELGSPGPAPLATSQARVSVEAPPPGARPARARTRPATPDAAGKVVLPERAYYLFHGRLSDAGDWGALNPWAYMDDAPESAFTWPVDHAWCVAKDVDSHWAGIAATPAIIDQLVADPRLDVVRADPTVPQPRYQ